MNVSKTYRDKIAHEGFNRAQLKKVRNLERAKKRVKEFRCLNCKALVPGAAPGTKHRNHCPLCLWSRHVDQGVGVRLAALSCGKKMRPVMTRLTTDVQVLHRCEGCGHEKWNRIAADDNPDILISLESRSPRSVVEDALLGQS
ncbi:MAG TPA: RNHCP domain-containing protein [Candidatus Paceibacterota bacterium]